ncbi:MAG: formylmethanofuran dehydrogenase subunit A [Sterolibacteriaceae bacterium]|nr:formylmethanofuran dehydrogenase subunit A [Sterolibacteriaceae bacterium]MBK9083838.1 formylmethanofuran dehydrogenase subunit A [Sterolibacteriaceae bacterium]
MSMLRIVNGRIYDPANSVDGEVRDVCVDGGKIVADVAPEARRLDASGLVIMPGGVDIHCHIAGAKVNLARKLQPEDHRHDVHPRTAITRSGVGGTVPSTFTTGYRYALLGYTTAMEAAVPPINARHTLEELHDTPIIDKGFYVLMGNNVLLYKLLEQGRRDDFRNALAWWLSASKAYTAKLVNPGGDEAWKGRRNANITKLDEKIESFSLTPQQVIGALIEAVDELGLPHPAHIHCNNLGHSGNFETTLETMRIADGHRAHITHIQFHSYGQVAGKSSNNPTSRAKEISEYVNSHPNISADVGQVMFGKSTSMTADAPLAYMLARFGGDKWVNADTEHESGCGILPFTYQDRIYTHALQWAIGLELFLLSKDPWRMVFSTDHPNGGSFMSYPRLIRLLMDSEFRKQEMAKVNPRALRQTALAEGLNREYTLNEIAIITRAGPARLLGLASKGHLGIGADADITLYEEHEDKERMFGAPRHVIKDGQLVIEDHEFRAHHEGRVLHVAPDYDPAIAEVIRPFFEDYYSIRFNNYAVDDAYLGRHERVPTAKQRATGT